MRERVCGRGGLRKNCGNLWKDRHATLIPSLVSENLRILGSKVFEHPLPSLLFHDLLLEGSFFGFFRLSRGIFQHLFVQSVCAADVVSEIVENLLGLALGVADSHHCLLPTESPVRRLCPRDI